MIQTVVCVTFFQSRFEKKLIYTAQTMNDNFVGAMQAGVEAKSGTTLIIYHLINVIYA